MAIDWTDEKLLALDSVKLERLRQNAVERDNLDLAQRCTDIQLTRKTRLPTKINKLLDPVVGFHFVCKGSYEVVDRADGNFHSGVWAVSSALCDPALALGGYVALHESKDALSYRQGKILGWTLEPRTKGSTKMGVQFHLRPIDEPFTWYGRASGEKGYRRVSDSPSWPETTAKL